MSELTREIIFAPAFDKRAPEPEKNYGIHGAEMRWYLKGPKGAIQFVVFTNWFTPDVQKEIDAKMPDRSFPYLSHKPMAADIGYHSPVPMYEDQHQVREDCDLLDGKPCYYDGSGLEAETVFEILVIKGGEAVWEYMEKYYEETFNVKATT